MEAFVKKLSWYVVPALFSAASLLGTNFLSLGFDGLLLLSYKDQAPAESVLFIKTKAGSNPVFCAFPADPVPVYEPKDEYPATGAKQYDTQGTFASTE